VFTDRDLSSVDYVYLWADGIHVNVRLAEEKLSLLVVIGVDSDGREGLVTLADGYRESTGSWVNLLRDCARRGNVHPRARGRRRRAGLLDRATQGLPRG
jgi:transposase-like protein